MLKRVDWVRPTMAGQGWATAHLAAIDTPLGAPISSEMSIVDALRAWNDYAHSHQARFDRGIGQDSFLGPAWAQWGVALRKLLNGDLGRLDGGTLDHIIVHNLEDQGFTEEGEPKESSHH